MFTRRAVRDTPVSGGDRFEILVGPSRSSRVIRRMLWGLSAVVAAVGLLSTTRGAEASVVLAWSFVSLGSLLVAEWIAGGAESLTCRADVLSWRRRRLFRARARTWPVLDVTRVRPPRRGSWLSDTQGLLVETAGGVWEVGSGIAWCEADEIAGALERYLGISAAEVLSSPAASRLRASRLAPVPASPAALLDRARRFRRPPSR